MLLCKQNRDGARVLLDARQPNTAWNCVGFALECCLKAAIMKKEGMNRWPESSDKPELWTHDLQALSARLHVDYRTFDPRDPSAASWKMAFEWNRGHGYAVNKLPMKIVEQMYEAAFGADGVIEWLGKRYRLSI